MLKKNASSLPHASVVALRKYWRAQMLPALALRVRLQEQLLRPLSSPLAFADVVPHPWGLLALLLRSPSRLLDGLTSAHHRYLDRMTATLTQNPVLFPNGFFCDGWGDISTPKRVHELLQSNRMSEVNELAPEDVMWSEKQLLRRGKVCIQEGTFKSTLPNAKELLPGASLDAFCELVTPMSWEHGTETPVHGSRDRPLVGT